MLGDLEMMPVEDRNSKDFDRESMVSHMMWSDEHFDLILLKFSHGFKMPSKKATSTFHTSNISTLFPSIFELEQSDNWGKSGLYRSNKFHPAFLDV